MKNIVKILNAGLGAVCGEKVIKDNFKVDGNGLKIKDKTFDLNNFSNIYILGSGKVAGKTSKALEDILGDRIKEGLVVVKEKSGNLNIIKEVTGNHPVPDEKSQEAGLKILDIARKSSEKDFVIYLLSGGASALTVAPKGTSLKEQQKLVRLLLKCGANIKEINTIRKHISNIKGGNLAKVIYPATCITLIISDVFDNDISSIGSGPTVGDVTTFSDCMKVFDKYNLDVRFPKIHQYFLKNLNYNENETLKPGDIIFEKTFNFIIADLDLALKKTKEKANELGYKTEILSDKIAGIASEEGEKFAEKVRKLENMSCLITGGETTVVVKGEGRGGRNLETAMGFLKNVNDLKGIKFLSVGTDGDDGTSGIAGVVVGEEELKKAHDLNLDFDKFLDDNNSLEFFQKAGGILEFPQNTNVGDIQILLKD